jgi:hypothetical protein
MMNLLLNYSKEIFLVAVTTFYIDDSGTRHPDRKASSAKHGKDWFALGGILIEDEQKATAEAIIDAFRMRWPQIGDNPLHSCEIRGSHGNFAWLGKDSGTRSAFMEDLQAMLLSLPVIGLACVIDRPGYNKRYGEKYGHAKWMLCKTAFAIAVERAVKYAQNRGNQLRIYVERSSKTDDANVQGYYKALKESGHFFDPDSSAKYGPASDGDYRGTLYEFKTKAKTSRLMQIADLYLWPICIAGYDTENRPYRRLVEEKKLIECYLPPDEVSILGSKYSCFDLV